MEEIPHNDRAGARGALGRWLLVVLTLLLAGSSSAFAASAPTPVNTSAPTLTGTPTPGQVLSCSPGSWSGTPSSFSYVWLRDGSLIAGQTGSAYSVQSADQGHSIACSVTATNSGGEYTIAGLPSGSYQVSFEHPLGVIVEGNFLPQYFNGQSSAATADLVSVTTGNTTSGIDTELQPGGQITGKVISAATHAPIANVEVCARNGTFVFGSCTATDAAGDYTIVGLPSGSYEVGVSVSRGVIVGECSSKAACPEQNYLGTGAEAVPVTAPDTTSDIDLELQPGGQITGKVTDAKTHLPVASVLVCAYQGEITEFQRGCATTGADGNYTINGLTSLEHNTLTFAAQTCVEGEGCTRQNYQPQTIKAVSVTAPNNTTVDAQLQPGGEITGTVTSDATHAPIAGASVCAVEEGAEVEHSCAHTNAAGQYTVAGLASGSYIVSSTSEYAEATHTGAVVVTAPNTTTGVNIEIQPKPRGKITGTVTDANTHAPVASIDVCVGQDGCITTNSAGEYTFVGLPSGSYEVTFGPSFVTCFIVAPSGCIEPNYLSQTISGVSVTAPNTTTGVNAQLQTGGEITGRITSITHTGLEDVAACAYSTTESFAACGTTNGPGGSASASSPAVTVTGSISGSKSTGAATVRSTAIQAALSAALRSGRLATIASLLEGGHYSLRFTAPQAGTLTLEWVINKATTSSRRGNHHHRSWRIVIATGSKRFSSAGSGNVRLHLTAAGRKLLKGRKTLLVTEIATFTPTTGSSQTARRTIRLRPGRTRPRKKR